MCRRCSQICSIIGASTLLSEMVQGCGTCPICTDVIYHSQVLSKYKRGPRTHAHRCDIGMGYRCGWVFVISQFCFAVSGMQFQIRNGRELPFLRIAETSGINRADFSSKFSVSDGLSQHLPNHAPHSLRHHPIDHMRSHLTGPLPSCLVFRSSR